MIYVNQPVAGISGLLYIAVTYIILTGACSQPVQPTLSVIKNNLVAPSIASSQSPAASAPGQDQSPAQSTDFQTTPFKAEPQYFSDSPVQIVLIHFRGTLERLGCCTPGLFERDEFVAVKNLSNTPQSITGWVLKNATKAYPSFTFPSYFPCIPFIPPQDQSDQNVPEAYYKYVQNPAQSMLYRFPNQLQTSNYSGTPAANQSEIDWSSCLPLAPTDETPMKPARGQQGKPIPCILYPGQTVLIFTDEIHCPYGGLSFKYGQGNIWDNERPDTAVLYNAQGEEVSRRSYFVSK